MSKYGDQLEGILLQRGGNKSTVTLRLLLADDDTDDCFFFKEALEELPISATLTIVNDGVQLMQLLSANETLQFDVLFLDLNMPRKGGYECLSELKLNDKLIHLPVIIYSTSLNLEVADLLYNKGARNYICRPGEHGKLKKVIAEAIAHTIHSNIMQPARDKFILQP